MFGKRILLPTLFLGSAFLNAGQVAPVEIQEKRPPIDIVRKLPDMTVTQFAATGPASKTYGFIGGAQPSVGYVFVPIALTVTNAGKADAPPFRIAPRCRLQKRTVRQAGFLDYKGTQDKVGGGGAVFASSGLPPGSTGSDVNVPSPLPPGGKVKLTSTIAVPVGSVRGEVELWVVVDERNDVAESNERNNDSPKITVRTP